MGSTRGLPLWECPFPERELKGQGRPQGRPLVFLPLAQKALRRALAQRGGGARFSRPLERPPREGARRSRSLSDQKRRQGSGRFLQCGGLFCAHVAQQPVCGVLRLSRGGEDTPLVIAQCLQPARQVGGMVFAIMQFDADRTADERGPQFCDQFLPGIIFALRGKEGRTGKPVLMPAGVA